MKKRIMALIVILVLLCSTTYASAASDPAVTIVSPSQTVYGSNLLVSIKMTAPKNIKVFVYEEKQKVGDTLVSIDPTTATKESLNGKTIHSVSLMTPETYNGNGKLQFYNKQFSNVTPGVYRIKVETLNGSKEVTASSSIRVVVMEKDSESKTGSAIFGTQQTGAIHWVQNLLKSIFGN